MRRITFFLFLTSKVQIILPKTYYITTVDNEYIGRIPRNTDCSYFYFCGLTEIIRLYNNVHTTATTTLIGLCVCVYISKVV